MGNCVFGGVGEDGKVIKVVTSNGGIMEFDEPITVEFITDEFPGHGIFRNRDLFWKPLPHQEVLLAGESYFLLPLGNNGAVHDHQIAQVGHVRSNSLPQTSVVAPYRMSFGSQGMLKRSDTDGFFFSRIRVGNNNQNKKKSNSGSRVWKVKLVISHGQLLEILSQEAQTEELIESVRTVAKCRRTGSASSLSFSDQWSLSSSRNASSSKTDSFLDL